MPAWKGDREGVEAGARLEAAPVVVAARPAVPATPARAEIERSKPAAKSRSTRREAQELIDELAKESVEARATLMREARDEATRLRAAEGLSAAAGLTAPSVSLSVSLVVDMDEALAQLERLQLQRGDAIDVESEELGPGV